MGQSSDTTEEHIHRAIVWDTSLKRNLIDLNTFLPTNLVESADSYPRLRDKR